MRSFYIRPPDQQLERVAVAVPYNAEVLDGGSLAPLPSQLLFSNTCTGMLGGGECPFHRLESFVHSTRSRYEMAFQIPISP